MYYYTYIYVGDDYKSGPFNVTIPTGETTAYFNISVIDDDVFEADESFSVTIDPSSLSSTLLLRPSCLLIIRIVDDDGGELLTM